MPREQAVCHPVIRQGDGRKHHHRHHGVHQVSEPHPVPLILGHLHPKPGPEQCQPPGGDEPVVHLPVRPPETVSEVEEEAGGGAEAEEDDDHGGADRRAGAVAHDRREEHLEGEEGAGGEKVDEERGLGEGLLHSLGDDRPSPAGGRVGRRGRWAGRGVAGRGRVGGREVELEVIVVVRSDGESV